MGLGRILKDCSVAEAQRAARNGWNAVAGNEDAGEVEGVGGGDGDGCVVGARGELFAGGAEAFYGFGQAVLLAEGSGDEAAAADFAAGFEAAEDGDEVAPFGGVGLAGEELAEEDAVAAEEDAGVGVEGGFVLSGSRDGCGVGGRGVGVLRGRRCGVAEEGPAAGGGAGGGTLAEAGGGGLRGGGGLAAGVHHGAELVEAVGGGEAGSGELPESGGGVELVEAGEALEVGGEGGAVGWRAGSGLPGLRGEGLGEDGGVDALGGEGVVEPVGGLAEVEGDGRGGCGDDSSWSPSLNG